MAMRLGIGEDRQQGEGDHPTPGEAVDPILDGDNEGERHQHRAEHVGAGGHLRPAQRIIGGREQYLQGHDRHRQSENGNKGRHLCPLGPEQGFHQRIGGHHHAEIERAGDQHDQPNRFQKGPGQGARIRLQPGIGREGDFIERRHKFGGKDRRQKQGLGIEAEIMGIEIAAGDENIGLALDRPEQVARQQRRAESEHRARALEVERRQDIEFHRDHEADRPAPEYRQRRIDQRPHAIAIIGKIERGDGTDRRRDEIDDGRLLEFEIARHQRLG